MVLHALRTEHSATLRWPAASPGDVWAHGRNIPAILGALAIFMANGVDVRTIIWASLYTAAPVISGIMRMAAETDLAQADVSDFLLQETSSAKRLLQLSDLTWCAAYVCQFALWIQVFDAFSTLPRFTAEDSRWMNTAIGSSIAVAISLSAVCKDRFYEYWSLSNWDQKQYFVTLNVGFVLFLVAGMPTDADSIAKWRHALFVPLGALSIVVNMLCLVVLLEDLLAYLPEALRQGCLTGIPARARKGAVPDELMERINPLLSTAPEFWRRTLMLNFACCQIIFAALNFVLVEDAPAGTLPKSASDLAR